MSPKFLYICVQSQIWKLCSLFKPREFDIRNRVNRYGSIKEQKEDPDITQEYKLQETVTILLEQREEVIKPQELGGRILKRMVTLYAFILCTGNKSLYQLQEELY